jgi:hypothetical protein
VPAPEEAADLARVSAAVRDARLEVDEIALRDRRSTTHFWRSPATARMLPQRRSRPKR